MKWEVIVTGSRDWEPRGLVWYSLTEQLTKALVMGFGMRVKVGDCPTGADLFTREWAENRRSFVDLEVFEADWSRGKRGGPMRNRRMVLSGADYGLVFNRNNSNGASGTKELLEQACIEYDDWTMED